MVPPVVLIRQHAGATSSATNSTSSADAVFARNSNIIDIRGNSANTNTTTSLTSAIKDALLSRSTPFTDPRIARAGGIPKQELLRSIPTMVLYDDKGLEIFDKITYIDEYYLTNAEINIFENHAAEIVDRHIRNGSALIELGCGAMRKTRFILDAIAKSGKNVTYFAVDLSETSLRQSLAPLAAAFPTIDFVGLWGTYDDSLLWLKNTLPAGTPKLFLWLGSSIGNLTRTQAAQFLQNICANTMDSADVFLCGIDRRNDYEPLSRAYNDSHGITRDFIMNGLDHINHIFNQPIFNRSDFEYVSIYNEVEGRHEAYYKALKDLTIESKDPTFSVQLTKDELINVEYSYKYSADEVDSLVKYAGFEHPGMWTDSKQMYDLHLFVKP
eukprot:jgi/Hompol1/6952/HPOL_005156-RA